jgi:hypothetical protein
VNSLLFFYYCPNQEKIFSQNRKKHMAKSSNYFIKENVNTEKIGMPSFLAIVTATQIAYQRDDGIWVIPLGCLKD